MRKVKTQKTLHRLLAAALCICVACGTAFSSASPAFAENVCVVTFDNDGGGGNSLDDNPMKTAIDDAITTQDPSTATTLRLEGSATAITGYNQQYLLSLFIQQSPSFGNLDALDYSGLTGLLTISDGYSNHNEMTDLKKVKLPNSVTTIGAYAFNNCVNLDEILITGSVTTIGDYAFNNCKKFTELEIPASVDTIGNFAFYDCPALAEVRFYGSQPPTLGSYAFSGAFNGVIKHKSDATGFDQNWLVNDFGASTATLETLESGGGGGGTDSGAGGSVNAADYIHEVTILDNYGMKNDGSGKYIEGETVTIFAAFREGYTFTGWEKVSGGGILDNPNDPMTNFSMPDGDVVLRATWRQWADNTIDHSDEPSKPGISTPQPSNPENNFQLPTGSSEYDYTLTFDPAGGIMSTTQQLLKAGETPSEVPDPTRDGYTFAGWYNGYERVKMDRFTMPQADVTLTARWDEVTPSSSQTTPVDGAAFSEPTLDEPHSESPPSMGIMLLVLLPIIAIAAFTILKKRSQNAEK